jgi:hypothetical protein
MIVQPDFINHWKTNALAAKIGRLEALTAILSLWAHCQQRRTWNFQMTPLMLAGICNFSGDADTLFQTMVDVKFLDMEENGSFTVHEWAEVNAALVHNWEAGKKGGRPPKNPRDNPTETQGLSQGLPLGKPEGKPIRDEMIRKECTPTRTIEPSIEGLTQVMPHLDPKKIPTLKQAKDFAPQAGVDPEIAETWWHEMEGAGWLDRNNRQVVRWQNTLTSYARKWQSNENRWKKPINGSKPALTVDDLPDSKWDY